MIWHLPSKGSMFACEVHLLQTLSGENNLFSKEISFNSIEYSVGREVGYFMYNTFHVW